MEMNVTHLGYIDEQVKSGLRPWDMNEQEQKRIGHQYVRTRANQFTSQLNDLSILRSEPTKTRTNFACLMIYHCGNSTNSDGEILDTNNNNNNSTISRIKLTVQIIIDGLTITLEQR